MKVRTEHIKETVREFSFNEPAESFPVLAAMMAAGECRFTGSLQVALTAERELDHYRVEGTVSVRCRWMFPLLCSCDRTVFPVSPFSSGRRCCKSRRRSDVNWKNGLISSVLSVTRLIYAEMAYRLPWNSLNRSAQKVQGYAPSRIDLNSSTCSCVVTETNQICCLKDFKVPHKQWPQGYQQRSISHGITQKKQPNHVRICVGP